MRHAAEMREKKKEMIARSSPGSSRRARPGTTGARAPLELPRPGLQQLERRYAASGFIPSFGQDERARRDWFPFIHIGRVFTGSRRELRTRRVVG